MASSVCVCVDTHTHTRAISTLYFQIAVHTYLAVTQALKLLGPEMMMMHIYNGPSLSTICKFKSSIYWRIKKRKKSMIFFDMMMRLGLEERQKE